MSRTNEYIDTLYSFVKLELFLKAFSSGFLMLFFFIYMIVGFHQGNSFMIYLGIGFLIGIPLLNWISWRYFGVRDAYQFYIEYKPLREGGIIP